MGHYGFQKRFFAVKTLGNRRYQVVLKDGEVPKSNILTDWAEACRICDELENGRVSPPASGMIYERADLPPEDDGDPF